jgi:hypothetical protein
MKPINLHLILFAALLLAAAGIRAQVPKLNSYPSAPATLFLDFDGQTVTGTAWNWGGPIVAQPSGFSTSAITEIFNRVSEDYRPFNINITTDSTVYFAAPIKQRTRIIITPTWQWYPVQAGGVAFVGSFIFGDDTPAWVFSGLLNNNTKYVAEAISHESGHTLGLQHQSSYDGSCNKTAEYSAGVGTGEIGWAPIMGVGYSKNLTTWHKGPNTVSCGTIQDDMAVIAGAANGFGYRPASTNTDPASATDISLQAQGFSVDGTISRTGEMNTFKIVVPINTTLMLNAIPESVGIANGINNNGANIDIRVKILNSNKDTIGVYNPSTLLNAGIDTALYTGTYYLLVDGASNANMAQYGSLGFYSMAGSLATTLPIHQFVLRGSIYNSTHNLSWSYQTDESIKELIVEGSDNGKNFKPLAVLNSGATTFQYKALKPLTYYRVRAVTIAAEISYYSNTLTLSNSVQGKAVQLLNNRVTDAVNINSNNVYSYQLLDVTGKLVAKGTLQNGLNRIAVPSAVHGMLFLRLNDGTTEWTEKLIKY